LGSKSETNIVEHCRVIVDVIMERPKELSSEGKELVKDAVREIATPVKTSWESMAAVTCMVVFFVTRPPVVADRIPYLLERSVPWFIADFVLLGLSAGFGWSAARNTQRQGRIVGATSFVVSAFLLVYWLLLPVN
jgi:hypothetical protein